MKCSIYELLDGVKAKNGALLLYTDGKGIKKMTDGDSFYLWGAQHKTLDDVAILVFEKDLAEDARGHAYCVDGLDVIIL